jgi:hypothetical protein
MKSKFHKAVLAISVYASISAPANAMHSSAFDEAGLQKFIYRANACLAAPTVTDDCMRAADIAGNLVRYQMKPVRYPDLWLAPGELADFQRAVMTAEFDLLDPSVRGRLYAAFQAEGFTTMQAARISSWLGESGGLDKLCKLAIALDPVAGRSAGCGTL